MALVLAVVAIVIVCFAAALVSPPIAWRERLLAYKLTGRIPQIPLTLLVKWTAPNSPVNLHRLSEEPDVNISIGNTFTDRESGRAGAKTFGHICASCHGDDARGGVGPNLVAAIGGLSDWQFFATVKWGRPGTPMRPQPLSAVEIWQVEAFIRQTALAAQLGKKYAAAAIPLYQPVTTDMIAAGAGADWLTYAGDYAGTRHSPLTAITPANVGNLRLAWVADLPTDGGDEESSPIVVGPWMFVTEPAQGVTALDARSGDVLWQFNRRLPDNTPQCCGMPNRGVAVLGENVYVETFDAHLIALSAATGAKVWDTTVADWHHANSLTSAPLVAGDRLILGVAGGDFGIRGFIAAYSSETGVELWRFNTIPGPGEFGNDTWGGDSWKTGGAAAWFSGAYDRKLGLVYFGTGNPTPILIGSQRRGANLYSDCLVALDVKTGKLRWYYQFTPGDDHGWDSTEQPILSDIEWQGQSIPVLLLANRNGFFYALDRRNGRFLYAKAFAQQSWNSGFTPDGHPIMRPGADPTPSGTVVSPPAWGATSWWSPSYDPQRNLVFVPSVDSSDLLFAAKAEDYREGRVFEGSGYERAPDRPTTLALRAIDAATGQIHWNTIIDQGGSEVPGEMGGALSTAGGVVFAGHESEFDAYNADTGAVLWRTPLGAIIHDSPISYALGGRQYVAIFSRHALFVFALPGAAPNAGGS